MDSQMTLRLPRELDRALGRRAKERGVAKSQLVREALARYIAEPDPMSEEEFMARAAKYIGSVRGDQEAMLADPLARQIYERNFRE
jgi:predicted DNA-binding protein